MGDIPMSTPIGPYSPIVTAGPWRICSGQLGLTAEAGRRGERPSLVDGGAPAQLVQALTNGEILLVRAGAALLDVVKTTVFLATMDDYAAVNETYADFFSGHRPARSVVAVAGLPMDAAVEVQLWAFVPGDS